MKSWTGVLESTEANASLGVLAVHKAVSQGFPITPSDRHPDRRKLMTPYTRNLPLS